MRIISLFSRRSRLQFGNPDITKLQKNTFLDELPGKTGIGYRFRIIFLVIILLEIALAGAGHSQEIVFYNQEQLFAGSEIDTAILLSDQPLKSPLGAVGRSAVFPGWGQVYSEHYIKGVVAFSVNAFMIYQIYRYEQMWRDEKNESFREKRNLYTWYFSLTYLLTMVDAYVDASLYKFDEAVEIAQFVQIKEGACTTGLQFTYHFH